MVMKDASRFAARDLRPGKARCRGRTIHRAGLLD